MCNVSHVYQRDKHTLLTSNSKALWIEPFLLKVTHVFCKERTSLLTLTVS